MKKLLLLISFALVMTGCSTVPTEITRPETIEISFPPLEEVHQAYVGDKMVTQGVQESQNTAYFEQDVDIDFRWVIRANEKFVETGKNQEGIFYTSREPFGVGIHNASGFQSSNTVYIKGNGSTCIITSETNGKFCEEPNTTPAPIIKKVDSFSEKSFQQTLLYSGIIGNQIHVSYREFSGNTARPAFSNDVIYDLRESKIVGYKGALIEVIDADNMKIKYKVLRNFNAATQ